MIKPGQIAFHRNIHILQTRVVDEIDELDLFQAAHMLDRQEVEDLC